MLLLITLSLVTLLRILRYWNKLYTGHLLRPPQQLTYSQIMSPRLTYQLECDALGLCKL